MSNPKECIICSRHPEESELFVETDDGYICNDCAMDLKEMKKDHFGSFDTDYTDEASI